MAPLPCLSIWMISCFMHNHTPFRLMAMTRSHSSSGYSWVGILTPVWTPALLKAQSSRPYAWTVLFTISSKSASLDTSASMNMLAAPISPIMRTVSLPPSAARSTTITLAPSLAKAMATALPIPDPPPVTSPTLSTRLPAIPIPPWYSPPFQIGRKGSDSKSDALKPIKVAYLRHQHSPLRQLGNL